MHRQIRHQRLLPVVDSATAEAFAEQLVVAKRSQARSDPTPSATYLGGLEAPRNTWDDEASPIGDYFRAKRAVSGQDLSDEPTTDALPPAAAPPSPPHKAARPTSPRGGKTYRAMLAERQAALDEFVASRIQDSLDAELQDEALRLEACRRQRSVEQLKLLQATRQRLEKQVASKQPVKPHALQRFGIDVGAFDAQAHHGAEERRLHRERCMQAFYASSTHRMAIATVHRQQCRQAEFEKARARVALEEYVGTAFSSTRRQQWAAAGVDIDGAASALRIAADESAHGASHLGSDLPSATLRDLNSSSSAPAALAPEVADELSDTPAFAIMFRCPTADELHRTRVAKSREQQRGAAEVAAVSTCLTELQEFDVEVRKTSRQSRRERAAIQQQQPLPPAAAAATHSAPASRISRAQPLSLSLSKKLADLRPPSRLRSPSAAASSVKLQ